MEAHTDTIGQLEVDRDAQELGFDQLKKQAERNRVAIQKRATKTFVQNAIEEAIDQSEDEGDEGDEGHAKPGQATVALQQLPADGYCRTPRSGLLIWDSRFGSSPTSLVT